MEKRSGSSGAWPPSRPPPSRPAAGSRSPSSRSPRGRTPPLPARPTAAGRSAAAARQAPAEQTGGRSSITEQLFPMGMATPLHSQPEDDETFYVLEGDLTFYLEDGQPLSAPPGSFVHVPAGTTHAYQVDSETARLLNATTPRPQRFPPPA